MTDPPGEPGPTPPPGTSAVDQLSPGPAIPPDEQIVITRAAFDLQAQLTGLAPPQAELLWHRLRLAPPRGMVMPVPVGAAPFGLTGTRIAYFFGGLLSLGAILVLLGDAWSTYGSGVASGLAVFYVAMFVALSYLAKRRGLTDPAGLMATCAVCFVPMALAALQATVHLVPDDNLAGSGTFAGPRGWIRSQAFWLETATCVAGAAAYAWQRFALVIATTIVPAYLLLMDGWASAFGVGVTPDQRSVGAVLLGALLLAGGIVVDRHRRRDEAFWFHLGGLASLFGGLVPLFDTFTEARWAAIGLIGLACVVASALFARTAYALFGVAAACGWLIHLAYDVFKDSLLFPGIIALLGLGIVFLAVAYAQHGERWRAAILEAMPPVLRARRAPAGGGGHADR